ncbi:hypothetical protein RHO13_08565 [Orbus wheelerorum]|uniref:hypothetical protein n=1 Tax=Orbus wheelerorum TaxID=3074111 RepID=UPI00370DB594
MIVRELDKNHDWTFGRGKANYLSQSDAIKQCIKTKILALKGNWILNADEGIAWFDYLTKNPNVAQLERDVKNAIASIDGVTEIISFDIGLDSVTRVFLIQITYSDNYNNTNEVEFNVTSNR